MTPAPISVERLRATVVFNRDVQSPFPHMETDPEGQYVRHSDYAALLQQLAELERDNAIMRGADYHQVGVEQEQEIIDLEAKLAEREAEINRIQNAWCVQAAELHERLDAAERAREEACGLPAGWHIERINSRIVLTSPQGNAAVVSDECTRIVDRVIHELLAAFLAASGGVVTRELDTSNVVTREVIVRHNDDGSLDEVVGSGQFHLEQMDYNKWWIQLGPHMVTLTARGKISAWFGKNEAATPASGGPRE